MPFLQDYLDGIKEFDAAASRGEFAKGLNRATGSTLGGIQALGGQLLEPLTPETGRSLIESGLRRAQTAALENPAAVNEFTDIDSLGGAVDWAAGSIGAAVPTVLTSIGGGGLGGLGVHALRKKAVDAALKSALERGVAKEEIKQLATKLTMPERIAGSTIGLLPQEAGEQVLNLNADPVALANTSAGERIALSLGKGVVNAGLESIVPNVMLGKFARPTQVTSGKLMPAAAKTVGEGVLGEFGTEAAQQFTGDVTQHIANPQHDWFDPKGLFNAGMAGAVGGGAMGGVGAALSTAGKVMGKDGKSTFGDQLFEAGRNKARREFAAMDELDRMAAERQGKTPEELILERSGLSGNVTADDVMRDDQERTSAASNLAIKLVNDVAAPESLRKSAAEFISRAQNDPMAHVDFTQALQNHKEQGGALQAVNDLLDSFGITLPPERRTKSNAQKPLTTADVLAGAPAQQERSQGANAAKLWLDKFGHMTEAFSKLDTNDATAINAVEQAFDWVKRGMPEFEKVAPQFLRAFGKDAGKHIQTIYDYSVAEGLIDKRNQTSASRLVERQAQFDKLASRGVGRLDKLGNLLMPSMQSQLTTRDLKTMDRALNKFAEDRSLSAADVKAFRERMVMQCSRILFQMAAQSRPNSYPRILFPL